MARYNEFNPVRMPKYRVELHVHLTGAIRLTTIWELAQKKKINLGVKTLDELFDRCRVKCPSTLENFLKPFCIYLPVLVGDREAIERIAYEFCEDAAKQCVLYCEVRYCPHLLSSMYGPTQGTVHTPLMPNEVVMCVNRGLSRGSVDFEITVRSILCCFRGHPEWSNEIAELCVAFKHHGVVGIDIAGDEANKDFSAPEDRWAFQYASMNDIHRTVHAGEAGPAGNVRRALRELNAERIGHGYHVVDDPVLYAEVQQSRIHFEVCPFSSSLTGSVPGNCPKHPIVRFAEDGVNFSISRDDPTLTQRTLDEEYDLLRGLGLQEVHFVRANFNAARSSFLPEKEKQELLRKLRQIYGTGQDNDAPPQGSAHMPPRLLAGAGDF